MNRKLLKAEFELYKTKINEMTPMDVYIFKRFAPLGHIIFSNNTLYEYFEKQVEKCKLNPEISKLVGWENTYKEYIDKYFDIT